MIIEAFGYPIECLNEDKVERAINGTLGKLGQNQGGVGAEATGEEKVTEYDRLGGGMRINGDRVKPGCLYDFKNKKAFKDPVLQLEFLINGKRVVVNADEPLPAIVRASKDAEQGVETSGDEEVEEDAKPKKTTRKRGVKSAESETLNGKEVE